MDTATAPSPTTPASTPAPTTTPAVAPSDAFKALDSKSKVTPAPIKPDTKPADTKPDATAKPAADKPAVNKDDRTVKEEPKALREKLQTAHKELEASRNEITSMKAKIASYDDRGKDTTVLSEQLATLEKERDDLRSRLAGADFRATDDYRKQYEEPYQKAMTQAKNVVERLKIKDPLLGMDDNGEIKTRPATWDDFARLFGMPEGADIVEAKERFGGLSSLVEHHLIKLKEMYQKREEASAEQTKNWKEKMTQTQAQQTKLRQAYHQMLSTITADLAQNVGDYHDTPDDPESKSLRDEGYAIFDAQPQTMEEAAVKAAHVRHRVAAHSPLVRKVQSLTAQLAERDATIEELRKGKPGKTSASSDTGDPEPKSIGDELRETLANA